MKIRVAEASGGVLDYMVAKCEGYDCQLNDEVLGPWLVPQDGYLHDERNLQGYDPSGNWRIGGPIVGRESIPIRTGNPLYFPKGNENGDYYEPLWLAGKQHGRTALEAAMRYYVASKLGDEVEVPDELLRGAIEHPV